MPLLASFSCSPRPALQEAAARRDSIAEVAAVAAGIWPGCKLEIYGSYATGLYTPASDVDCVLMGEWA
jgi:non-canonical poly(A) RNA polymerase PAPD5/7